jgi:uncharacterized protein
LYLSSTQLDIIKNFFQDKPVKKVYLFGSYADGNATPESDIDLLIDIDYTKKIGLSFFTWGEDLANILKKKVDIISNANKESETSNWRFIQSINKQKVALHEKE